MPRLWPFCTASLKFQGRFEELLLGFYRLVPSRNFRKCRCGNRSLAPTSRRQSFPRAIVSFTTTLAIDRHFRAAARSARGDRRARIRFYSITRSVSINRPTARLSRESHNSTRERFAFSFYQNFICVREKF